MDGAPTKPISKRRMIAFWQNSGVEEQLSITEKDLLPLCRHHSTISFEEFVFLVRCRLDLGPGLEQADASPPSSAGTLAAQWPGFAGCASAVERLAAMLRAAQRGRDIMAYRTAMLELRADAAHHPFSLLERSALNVVVASVAFDVPELGAVVPEDLLTLMFERLALLAEELTTEGQTGGSGRSPLLPSGVQASAASVRFVPYTVHRIDTKFSLAAGAGLAVASSSLAAGEGTETDFEGQRVVPVADVEGAVEFEWVRLRLDSLPRRVGGPSGGVLATAAAGLPPPDDVDTRPVSSAAVHFRSGHRLCDVLDSVLCYDLGHGLGFFTQQPETIHAVGCNTCGCLPIVGYAFKCSVCVDFDVCLRCFHEQAHERHHTFTRFPGGAVVPPAKFKVTVPSVSQSIASSARASGVPVSSGAAGDSEPRGSSDKNLRKVGFSMT
jgi:hypothetical protein